MADWNPILIEFFSDVPTPSRRTITLEVPEPPTEMNRRKYLGDKARQERKARILTAIFEMIF
jgi:hypothetical protein